MPVGFDPITEDCQSHIARTGLLASEAVEITGASVVEVVATVIGIVVGDAAIAVVVVTRAVVDGVIELVVLVEVIEAAARFLGLAKATMGGAVVVVTPFIDFAEFGIVKLRKSICLGVLGALN